MSKPKRARNQFKRWLVHELRLAGAEFPPNKEIRYRDIRDAVEKHFMGRDHSGSHS